MSEDVVYVVAGAGGWKDRRIHTDPDCHRLARADEVREWDVESRWDDERICSTCAGEDEHSSKSGHDGVWKQLQDLDPDDLGGASA